MRRTSPSPRPTTLFVAALALLTQTGSAALIGFQAEDYDADNSTLGNSLVVTDLNALGGEAFEFGTGTTIRYTVTFSQTGDYDLYFRGLSTSSSTSDDSFETPDALDSDTTGQDGVIDNSGVYKWYNSTTSGSSSSAPVYTVSVVGTYSFTVKNYRNESPRLDAYAFGESGTTYTDGELDAAVIPEPGSFALMLVSGIGGALLLRRRRS